MENSRIYVDFNEMLEPDLVLLSQNDAKENSEGKSVEFFPGQKIYMYSICGDVNEKGEPCLLLASGIVEKNTSDTEWAKVAKWLCRIDKEKGIQHSFDLIK